PTDWQPLLARIPSSAKSAPARVLTSVASAKPPAQPGSSRLTGSKRHRISAPRLTANLRRPVSRGVGLITKFGELPFEGLLEGLQVGRRRLVTGLLGTDAHAPKLVQIPDGLLSVAEGDGAAHHGSGAGEGVDADGNFALAQRRSVGSRCIRGQRCSRAVAG